MTRTEIIKSVLRLTFAAFLALIAASSLGLAGSAANASASNSIASRAYQQTNLQRRGRPG
jgi:hypothetical protein